MEDCDRTGFVLIGGREGDGRHTDDDRADGRSSRDALHMRYWLWQSARGKELVESYQELLCTSVGEVHT